MYDIVVFFVLGLSMLIVPSLTATSVNGDREHGVLATLQTTLLTEWDIALGKLLSAWVVALAFLATALPFLAWAWAEGGVSGGRIVLSLFVLVLVLAVVCAIGLMFSTLTARPVSSAVLTYLTMGALVFGTTIGFGLSAFLVTQQEKQQVYGIPDTWWEQHQPPAFDPADPNLTPEQLEEIQKSQRQPTRADCTTFTRTSTVAHTERIWWMLPLNPFVVVADAAPSEARKDNGLYASGFTPMRWISAGVRSRPQRAERRARRVHRLHRQRADAGLGRGRRGPARRRPSTPRRSGRTGWPSCSWPVRVRRSWPAAG